MIDKYELRLNNLVALTGIDNPATITEIRTNDVRCTFKHGKDSLVHDKFMPYDRLMPMPLTNDILLDMKFVNHPEGDAFEGIILPYWAKDGVLLFYNHGQEEYAWYVASSNTSCGINYVAPYKWIKYVHELQNSFFEQRNKELNLS